MSCNWRGEKKGECRRELIEGSLLILTSGRTRCQGFFHPPLSCYLRRFSIPPSIGVDRDVKIVLPPSRQKIPLRLASAAAGVRRGRGVPSLAVRVGLERGGGQTAHIHKFDRI